MQPLSFMLYGGINLYSIVVYIFQYSEKYKCYAGVSMTLTLFCTPAYFNKRNLTFIKLGTIAVNITTSCVIVSRTLRFFNVLA